MTTQARLTEGSDNGFFSTITSGFASGLSTIASDILPVWTANQLKVQQNDYLQSPTFNPAAAAPRQDASYQSTIGPIQTAGSVAGPQQTGVLFDNVNISGTALFAGIAAIVIGIVAARA